MKLSFIAFALLLAGCTTPLGPHEQTPFEKARSQASTDEDPKLRRELLKELQAHDQLLEKLDANYLNQYIEAKAASLTNAQLQVLNAALKKFERSVDPTEQEAVYYDLQMEIVRQLHEKFALPATQGQ